jgi:histidine ammonia-lyase
MPSEVLLDQPLTWRQVAAVAEGAPLILSHAARDRVEAARGLVDSIVAKGIRAYGINTGVGALCDVIVDASQLRHLSRNIIMSHAVGVGPALGRCEVRAIIAAAVNNFAHGFSGVRLGIVERLTQLLAQDCIPEVPAAGSVGYLTHMAHIALVLLGEGHVNMAGNRYPGMEALRAIGLQPALLEAKEGLSLVNGTPCVTGLFALALLRTERLLNWADVISAMTFENLHGQLTAFDAEGLALRASASLSEVGERLRSLLEGSAILAASAGKRTQDPLSLRAIPHVHGAARDMFARAAGAVDAELAAVTDNPIVLGTPEMPRALSEANAIGATIGLNADALGIAVAELAAMSERRIDRLVNPLVSRLIAQYTAVSLVAENRRLAAPASLDGGITSGLQEDHLCHPTPAALKLLKILDNAEFILGIELLATVQAYDLQGAAPARAPNTDIVYRAVRSRIPHYRDDRPLAKDLERARELIRGPTAVDFDGDIHADEDRQSSGPEAESEAVDTAVQAKPRRRPRGTTARRAAKPS